jgi:hypothetical protein
MIRQDLEQDAIAMNVELAISASSEFLSLASDSIAVVVGK